MSLRSERGDEDAPPAGETMTAATSPPQAAAAPSRDVVAGFYFAYPEPLGITVRQQDGSSGCRDGDGGSGNGNNGDSSVVEEGAEQDDAIVHAVVPDSPADRAGIRPGDVLAYPGMEGRRGIPMRAFVEMCRKRPVILEVVRKRQPSHAWEAAAGSSLSAAAVSPVPPSESLRVEERCRTLQTIAAQMQTQADQRLEGKAGSDELHSQTANVEGIRQDLAKQANAALLSSAADLLRVVERSHMEAMQQLVQLETGRGQSSGTEEGGGAKLMYQAYFWGGALRFMPRDFKFPTTNLYGMLEMWLMPDTAKGIPPLCLLRARHVRHIKSGAQTLNDMKSLIKRVEYFGRRENVWVEGGSDWTAHEVRALYEGVKGYFQLKNRKRKRRFEELSWQTILRDVREMKRRERKTSAEAAHTSEACG